MKYFRSMETAELHEKQEFILRDYRPTLLIHKSCVGTMAAMQSLVILQESHGLVDAR